MDQHIIYYFWTEELNVPILSILAIRLHNLGKWIGILRMKMIEFLEMTSTNQVPTPLFLLFLI